MDRNREFLCFGRGDAQDLVVDTPTGEVHKVLGSAQRRRRGAVLQHGSLLLRRSDAAPEFPGLFDLAAATDLPTEADLVQPFAETILSALDFPADRPPEPFTDAERAAIADRATAP